MRPQNRIVKQYQVGLQTQLTMLFADVRGSTSLAKQIGAVAFHRLINRYYIACAEQLEKSDALINRLIGDALIGLYVPGIAGPGEILVSEETCASAGFPHSDCDQRILELKGRSILSAVRVLSH